MIAGRGGSSDHAAGGPARHTPVLLGAVLEALAPRENEVFLDGTFGAGGYTRALLETPGVRVLAIDRDPQAVADGKGLVTEMQGRLTLAHGRFGDLETLAGQAGFDSFDGITFDIGVSSMQLDEAGRGFSFREDGPLDMRMGQEGQSAADLVNEAAQDELADIIFRLGEERHARRIARTIVADRVDNPFTTTRQLAGLLERVVPHKPGGIHPATRTFQALRIAVNDELGELARGLEASERMLRPGGRLAVVSFHSLEDRIVKQFFAARSGRGRAQSRLLPGETAPPAPTFVVSGRQPVTADESELQANPRARSARLRSGVRTDAPVADAIPGTDRRSRQARR